MREDPIGNNRLAPSYLTRKYRCNLLVYSKRDIIRPRSPSVDDCLYEETTKEASTQTRVFPSYMGPKGKIQ